MKQWTQCGVVVSIGPHSKTASGLGLSWGFDVWSLHALPVYAWVLSGFLPIPKNACVRDIYDYEIGF